MRLIFVIDKEYDINISMQLNKELSREHIEELYREEMPGIRLKQKLYQKSWNKINDEFSKYVETTTGYNWAYPEYICVLSPVTRGASNWGHAPVIIRDYRDIPYQMRRMTAHELILSHYFEIYRRHYASEGLKDGQVWALAEIAAFALTSLTKDAESFWPGHTGYYYNHKYFHIVGLQKELRKAFIESIERKDFDSYIKVGIGLVRKYPEMGPWGLGKKKVAAL